MKLVKFILPLALLVWATPVLAVDPPHGGEHGAAEHGAPEHGAAEHGEEHGEHAAHHYYTDDDDGDGTPNWRDPYNHSEPNEETYVVSSVFFHALNLALLLGVLVYYVRRPVTDTFRERALAIRTELTETARTRDEAHQRHQELLARLEKIENEVRTMDQEAEVEAKREEEKLIERAKREAARITEQVERNIRDESTRARTELRQDAVNLAIQLAEATLRQGVSTADQQALARQFLDSVKGVDRV
jgi:F-type H+-transporting ATPase subunit b